MSENIQQLYPHIGDGNSPSAPFEDEIISTIKKSRLHEFTSEKKKLEDLLVHYKKIKSRWTSADSYIKIAGVTIGGITTVCACVFASLATAGIGGPIIGGVLSSIFGGVGAIDLFLSETVSIGLTSKKKKIYREICEKLEFGISKLYLYQVKALSDNLLTNTEIEESMRIVEEVKRDINILKSHDDMRKVEKNVKKDLVLELKKEYKDKLSTLKS